MKSSQIEEEDNTRYIGGDTLVKYLPFPGEMTLKEYEDILTYFVQKWRSDGANYLHIEKTSPGLQPITKNM